MKPGVRLAKMKSTAWLDWGQAFTQVIQAFRPKFLCCFASDSPAVIPGFCHYGWDGYLGLSLQNWEVLCCWGFIYIPPFHQGRVSHVQSPPQTVEFVLCSVSGTWESGWDLRLDLQAGDVRLDSQALPETMVNTSLGDPLAVGQEGWSCGHLTQNPRYCRGFCKLEVGYNKWFSQGHGWISSRKFPLGFGLTGVLEKRTLCPESNVPQMWFSQLLSAHINFYYC